jgi:triacylglycerol lipase
MNIVLVHGIFDNGAIFRRLVDALTRAGHRCWVPSLKPADGRTGIRDLAAKLHAYIDRHLGTEAELALVGFSMGCIVSRHYLQMLGGVRRTKAFFAISGPHEGTLTAYLYPGQGAKDLRPGSPLLQGLKQTEDRLAAISLFTYWTSRDITIVPATSCCWALAPHRLDAKALLHRFMPGSAAVCTDVVGRVNALAVGDVDSMGA